MEKTFQELCKQYENAVPADIPAVALDAADQACARLQAIHDTIPAGSQQTQAAKEVISAVLQLKQALLKKAKAFHDELNPNVLSAFHDTCAQQASAIHGMMHITGNKIAELFPGDSELAQLADDAKSDGDALAFPYRIVREDGKYVVEMTHIHDGKPVEDAAEPQQEVKSYRYHIVQKDGKYIVEQG